MNMPKDDQRSGTSKPVESPQPVEALAARSGTRAARMDCPNVMREHLWSIERESMIECLWCFERRRSEDRERPSAAISDVPRTTTNEGKK